MICWAPSQNAPVSNMASDLDAFMTTMVGQTAPVLPELAEKVVGEHYGLEVSAERLTGERDENFKVTAPGGREYVLKVANGAEDPLITDLAAAALRHMEEIDPGFPCPRICRSCNGQTQIRFEDATGRWRRARLVTYLRGKPLHLASRSSAQRRNCGRLAARLGRDLRDFEHPASHRALVWDLLRVPTLRPLLDDLPGLPYADFIARFIEEFAAHAEPRFGRLRMQFVHNDLNSRNILVDPTDESVIVGVIDFGDAIHTALAADVAISAVAQITGSASMPQEISDLLRGYQEVEPLEAPELETLNWLIAARMVTGVLVPSWHRARNPGTTHYPVLDANYIQQRLELADRLVRLPRGSG